MATYRCPICGEEMERDLILFLGHADEHIVEAVKKKHPEWVDQDGICAKCLDYYKGQLKGDHYRCG